MKKIEIGKPYITKDKNKFRLNSDIKSEREQFTLWFEVDNKYSQYLCTERVDAFLVAVLPWAMMKSNNKSPLEICSKSPISEKLYHQLTSYLIPILVEKIQYFNKIKITTPFTNKLLPSHSGVATGLSAGVDSCYTLTKYITCKSKIHQLTHGVFFNMAMYGDYNSKSVLYIKNKVKKICKATNIQFMEVTSNICTKLYGKAHAPIVPYIFMGASLAFQKLFSTYYYSSGFSVSDFKISEVDAAYYDLLTVQCLSTENTQFYSSGIETTRLEKVKIISDFPFTYDNLSVCLNTHQPNGNCGVCAKCTRTMAELDVIGKLSKYKNSFDIDSFKKNPGYHWGYILLKSRTDSFCKEIVDIYKKSGRKFPPSVYFSCIKKWIERGFTSNNRKREEVKNEIRKL